MNLEQLEAKITELNAQVDHLKVQLRPLVKERDALLIQEAAKAKVEAMSDPEKAALLQQLRAEGVGSGEATGKPRKVG